MLELGLKGTGGASGGAGGMPDLASIFGGKFMLPVKSCIYTDFQFRLEGRRWSRCTQCT
jgi:hypothetical protein